MPTKQIPGHARDHFFNPLFSPSEIRRIAYLRAMPPIPILFATDGIFPHAVGGMQRHSRLLVEALARSGQADLTVLHPHPDQRIFAEFPSVTEIALEPLPGKKHYFRELKDYSQQVLREARERPDHIIYSQGLSVWAGMQEVADRTIVNPHGLEPYQAIGSVAKLKTLPYRRVFDKLFKRCTRTISLGGHLTNIIQPRLRRDEQLAVLPNATNPLDLPDADLFKSPGTPMRFMFVGRFSDNKGITYLLQATQALNEAGLQDQFEVDLCGKGPLFDDMRAQFPLPNVHFRGFVSDEDLAQAYLDNHVFVLPTLYEGMPTVILEAMARAMPIIVTDVGATRELVDEQNGFIIDKQDAGDLAEKMKGFLEMDPATYGSLSRHSLAKFKARFTWEAVAEAHLELFREVQDQNKNRQS